MHEAGPPPSFDECYPWTRGVWEPPIFQLNSNQAPFTWFLVMPMKAQFTSTERGWEAAINEATFEQMWKLSVVARQQHQTAEELAGAEPAYLMSVGCGDFYGWHVKVSQAYAQTGTDAAAQLAKQLFELMQNPPADAVKSQ